MSNKQHADVCLLLEGTYPYVLGGVSSWTHDLITEQSDLTFHIVSILPPGFKARKHYKLPKNVVSLKTVFLQDLPKGRKFYADRKSKDFFKEIEAPLLNLIAKPSLKYLEKILSIFAKYRNKLSKKHLLNSEEAWQMLLRMYNSSLGETPFIDFFWSWRALIGGFYSMMFVALPKADVYHSLCTGYAGLLLARAHLEEGKPCIVTEHGIYTNERRIEISSANWLEDDKSYNLSIKKDSYDKELRDFWIDTFASYSKLCYDASSYIITLYKGNQKFQIIDGADESKLRIIPNGIDYERFSKIKRTAKEDMLPTIAMIGRVVPIKDVKTFIRSCSILRGTIPDLKAFILGPREEDKEYYRECLELIKHLKLGKTIEFTGKVKIDDYLGQIDVNVLASISEAQPLVVLEVAAAGIPSVVTDVGACREMIYGTDEENPPLGAGGAVCPLSNPIALASEIVQLLVNRQHHENCSYAAQQRVKKYYTKEEQHSSYHYIYAELISLTKVREAS